MISRYYLLSPPSSFESTVSAARSTGDVRRRWVLLGAFTGLVLGWLFYRWALRPGWLDLLPQGLIDTLDIVDLAASLTLAFVWLGLALRHRQPAATPIPLPLTLEKLHALSPEAFEHYVAGLFRQKGYQVRVRGRSGDHGVDLLVRGRNSKQAIVQCKRYQNTVGEELVRDLYGTLIHERAARAFLVTTADISSAAHEWAKGKPITLIDGTTLLRIAAALSPEARESSL